MVRNNDPRAEKGFPRKRLGVDTAPTLDTAILDAIKEEVPEMVYGALIKRIEAEDSLSSSVPLSQFFDAVVREIERYYRKRSTDEDNATYKLMSEEESALEDATERIDSYAHSDMRKTQRELRELGAQTKEFEEKVNDLHFHEIVREVVLNSCRRMKIEAKLSVTKEMEALRENLDESGSGSDDDDEEA